ncbi:unnamed protein product, partial [Rotaria sp. Silwood2]
MLFIDVKLARREATTTDLGDRLILNSDLITPSTPTLSALDTDFLRHVFSQQFRRSLDLSAYFTAAAASNSTGPTSTLFRPNFLRSLIALPSSLSTTLVSCHGSYQ